MRSISTNRRFACGVACVLGVAIALRVTAVLAVGSFRLQHVTYEHGEIARNLVEGRGFTMRWMGAEGATSQQAPVYPTLVAGFYWLFGCQTAAAILALELFQATLGGLLAGLTVLLVAELLPDRPLTGWLAGSGAAIYPTLSYATTQVQVASLAALLVVAVLWLAARAHRRNSLVDAGCCGITGGLLILTDPILALVVLVALAMLLSGSAVRARSTALTPGSRPAGAGRRFRAATVALVACAAVISPWLVRNYLVHGELVLVKSTFGYAFWQGNHPRSFGTDKIPLPRAGDGGSERWSVHDLERSLWQTRLIDTMYIDDAVLPNERIAELGLVSEPERSRRLMAEAVSYIGEHPWHYVRLCLQRLRYFIFFDETNPKSRVAAYRLSHMTLLVVSLAGLWLSRRDATRLWPTYVAFALVTLFHTLTIVSARFHIPLEPLQLIWSACGLAAVLSSACAAVQRAAASARVAPAATCSGLPSRATE